MWNLQCKYGAFDISFEPSGGGYDHLARRATSVTIRDVEMPIADLADVVESKQLANRVKDQRALPELRAALQRLDRSAPAREPRTTEPASPEPGELEEPSDRAAPSAAISIKDVLAASFPTDVVTSVDLPGPTARPVDEPDRNAGPER